MKCCGDALLLHHAPKDTEVVVQINKVDLQESLTICEDKGSQLIFIESQCDWTALRAEVTIRSDASIHATAQIRFADRQQLILELKSAFERDAPQKHLLREAVKKGDADRFTSSMAYRMVSSLAHYEPTHRGVKDVILNSGSLEALATISTKPDHRSGGVFPIHPCVLDNILQVATFVMNANEHARFDEEVYVIRGWESAFLEEDLNEGHQYESYVKMNRISEDVATGDILVTRDGDPMGLITGVRAQRVPRRLMDIMFHVKKPISQNQSDVNPGLLTETDSPHDDKLVHKALCITGQESGHQVESLRDDDQLADIGIDSLLILVIASAAARHEAFILYGSEYYWGS